MQPTENVSLQQSIDEEEEEENDSPVAKSQSCEIMKHRSRSKCLSAQGPKKSQFIHRWKRVFSEWTLTLIHQIEEIPTKLPGFSQLGDQFQDAVTKVAIGLEKINMDLDSDIVTLNEIQKAHEYLKKSGIVVKTPTLKSVQHLFVDDSLVNAEREQSDNNPLEGVDLYLKMENMQATGSFKIRGCCYQMQKLKNNGNETQLVTMSGGNYGRAFARSVSGTGIKAVCIMPDTVPSNRVTDIQSYGVTVKLAHVSCLKQEVDVFVRQGYHYCKPFDDLDMIAGNASAGVELLEELPDPDVILVCCGGGGLVSGVAATVSLSGRKNCRVYAVEPEGAPTMHESFQNRRAMSNPNVKSVATGLCPPFAGELCYKHCRWFVEDVLLVSDEEILHAMRLLFHRGIKAEPSGCVGMAALLSNKVPDVKGKKVAVFITGGNVTCSELPTLIDGK